MSIKLPKNFPSCALLLPLTPGIGIQTAILDWGEKNIYSEVVLEYFCDFQAIFINIQA